MVNPRYSSKVVRIALTLGVLLFAIIPVHAALVTVPTGLNPGDQYRLAFVTSTIMEAWDPNITTYNTFVSSAATSVPALDDLGATWTAIASTPTVDARDNTSTTGTGVPIYNLMGDKVADDYNDLWDVVFFDGLDMPIKYNELGNVNSSHEVWTGTDKHGRGYYPLSRPFPLYGNSSDSTTKWIHTGTWVERPNTFSLSVYGISNELTVVPVPAAIWLLGSGLIAVLGLRRKSRKA